MGRTAPTASQIAEELGGVSRNAVIGKAHRLGLEARPSPVKPRIEEKEAKKPAAPAAAARAVLHQSVEVGLSLLPPHRPCRDQLLPRRSSPSAPAQTA